jgi:DNA polymerase-4
MNSKSIICIADMDCFFVEVERLHRPELKGRAVVIGGEPGKRGVVSACSYEARILGIHSAMPMGEAYRKARAAGARLTVQAAARGLAGAPRGYAGRNGAPVAEVVFLHSGLHGNYTRYSQRVQDILTAEVPHVRAKSVDEFALDLTGCERLFGQRHGGIEPFLEYLRGRVKAEVGLPLSVGVGPTEPVAKMASRHAKPDGVFRVLPGEVEAFLGSHDIEAVPGIGPATAARLRARGINRVGQLLALPDSQLRRVNGLPLAGVVHSLRHGCPRAERLAVEAGAFGKGAARSQPKSIGHETTFEHDVAAPAQLKQALWRLTEDACRRLRAQDLRAHHVTVRLRDGSFATHTHGGFLDEPTDVDRAVFTRVLELFHDSWQREPLRLVGVRLSRFSTGSSQPKLFPTAAEQRQQGLVAAVDAIRDRHGRDSVYVGPGVARLKGPGVRHGHMTAGISFTPVEQE